MDKNNKSKPRAVRLPETQENDTQHKETLMRFFEEAEKRGGASQKTAPQTSAQDGEALFSPELSEPLAILDENDTQIPAAYDPEQTFLPGGDDLLTLPVTTDTIQTDTVQTDTVTTDVTEENETVEQPTPKAETSPTEPAPQSADSPTDVPQTAKSGKSIFRRLALAAGGVVLAAGMAFGILTGLLYYHSRPQTVELDTVIAYPALSDNPIFSYLTAFIDDPAKVDTSEISEQRVSLVFWGFLTREAQISVRDLTPPVLETYHMTVPAGYMPDPEDCVSLCTDRTEVTLSFETAFPMAAGEHTVRLLARDAGGNVTAAETHFTVLSEDECAPIKAEFGTTEDGILDLLSAAYPDMTSPDLSTLDITVCGEYFVTGEENADPAHRRTAKIVLADTTAPVGRVHSFTYAAGNITEETKLSPENFVTEINDASPVTLSFVSAPDYTVYETQEIVVLLADAAGNETEYSCQLQLLDIPSSVTVECGTDTETFLASLLSGVGEDDRPAPDALFDTALLAPGEHSLRLRGKYSTLTVTVTAEDTTPPVLSVKPLTVYIDHAPEPSAFAERVSDATEVTLSFVSQPDVSKEGTYPVSVTAEDAGGNRVTAETTMTVVADTAPPVIYGVQNIYAAENSTISYRSGVSAYDHADGNVAVKVDASAVDITTSGTYRVIYTAADKAGNTSSASAYVFVTGANQTSINLYADQILSGIVTGGMTERQKAAAIYDWCVDHIRYSTSTSHLTGKYLQAAYSGFATHAGNCYTYCAVAASLLTRAGIENMEIHRNNPTDPHYWNLVKIDGCWYHLDTCPKMKKYPIKTFLLTDAQVAEYSRTQAQGYYSFDASLYPATP